MRWDRQSSSREAGYAHTPRYRSHPFLRRFARLRQRVVYRDGYEIFERLDVVGIDGLFTDAHALDALIARHLDGYRSARRAAGDDGARELLLRLGHLGLHFLELRHQVGLIHLRTSRSSPYALICVVEERVRR